MYLQKELGNDIVCVWKGDSGEGGIFYYNKRRKLRLEIKDWVLSELNRCINDEQSRFTVGIMTLLDVKGGENHANALIFDRESKTLIRFEPHGSRTSLYDSEELDKDLKFWLNKSVLKGWTYRPPNLFCPIEGPQTKEVRAYYKERMHKTFNAVGVKDDGRSYCSAWSLLFLHYRLMNPSHTDQEIVDFMVSHSSDELSDKIREYAAFISKTVDPEWSTVEKRKLLTVGDNIEFESYDGNKECG